RAGGAELRAAAAHLECGAAAARTVVRDRAGEAGVLAAGAEAVRRRLQLGDLKCPRPVGGALLDVEHGAGDQNRGGLGERAALEDGRAVRRRTALARAARGTDDRAARRVGTDVAVGIRLVDLEPSRLRAHVETSAVRQDIAVPGADVSLHAADELIVLVRRD